jgi:hypothetical protein
MTAHRAQATVEPGGTLTVRGLPLPAGEPVEVIVLAGRDPRPDGHAEESRRRLRGSVLKDERPFDPVVPPEEWDASR